MLDIIAESAAVITDPPYGMDLDTDFTKMRGRKYSRVIGDDRKFDPRPIMSLGHKEQIWFGADYYAELIPERIAGSWLVWDKRLDESADKIFGSGFELIWSKRQRKRSIIRHKWAGCFGLHREDCNRAHPTQKPVELMKRLIQMTGADSIVDPYMGSGSTLRAAKDLGIKAVGIELDRRYCDVAVRRLRQEVFAWRY